MPMTLSANDCSPPHNSHGDQNCKINSEKRRRGGRYKELSEKLKHILKLTNTNGIWPRNQHISWYMILSMIKETECT